MAAGGGAGNSWRGPGLDPESGQAQAASDPGQAACLSGAEEPERGRRSLYSPFSVPCTSRGCTVLQSPDMHGHTCTHVEAGGPTLAGPYAKQRLPVHPCVPQGGGLQERVEVGTEGPEAVGRRWGRCPEQQRWRRTHMSPPPSRTCLPFPKGRALGWRQKMEFGESTWGDGKSLAGTWEQVLSKRCLKAED